MTTLFDSARWVKPAPFARGLSQARRKPYTSADLKWAAHELNKGAADYAVLNSQDWDRMAAESFEMDRLEAGLCL